MAARDLPPEIWLHVSVFIPSKALRKLYPVNRALLELALDEKYRSVNPFNSPIGTAKMGRKFLFHLLEPHILHRIRHLVIKSTLIEPVLPTVLKARSRTYQAASRLPFNLGGLLDPHLESPNIFELVEQLISDLPPSMTSLEIDGFRCLSHQFFEIAAFAWNTLSRQLTALTVHGSWWELTYLLRITSTPLPLLTSLKLVNVQHMEARYQLFTPDADPDGEKPCIAFLESLAPTLRSLDIQLLQMTIPEFLPRVLQSLEAVPALRSFTVFGEREMIGAASPGLRHFIGRMPSTLVDLNITPHPENLAPNATLTNLRNLVISNPVVAGPDPVNTMLATTTSYVQASSSLTSLNIAGWPYTTSELQEFFTTPQTCLNNLRSLHLRLVSFNLDMLELLASTVPSLSNLDIQAFLVCPDKYGEDEGSIPRWGSVPLSVNDWLPAYIVHKPIDWNLNYLELQFSPGPHTFPLYDDQLKAELRRIIPSLTCIHNVLREKAQSE